MQRLASAIAAFTAIGVLAGCATNSAALLTAPPKVSESCGYSVIIEWADTNFVTRQEAIDEILTVYETELERASSSEGLSPVDGNSPVRLAIIVRGLTAAFDRVVEAERADPQANYLVVVGTLNGATISEVDVVQMANGSYVVSQFSAYGLTSDDPYCA